MNVNVFALVPLDARGEAPSRAWRVSTVEGVYWLLQSGTAARLLALPLPAEPPIRGTAAPDCLTAQGVALALAAETAAASRWVRQGIRGRSHDAPTTGDQE